MTESEMYQRFLKPEFNKQGFFYCRFEQPKIPDVFISCYGRVLWAELKVVNKLQKIIKPKWRPGQLAWLKNHERYNPESTCLILYYHDWIYYLPPKLTYKEEDLLCQKEHYFQILLNPWTMTSCPNFQKNVNE